MINPYTIVGALALLIAVAFGGAQVGKKLERESWQGKENAALKAVQAELVAEVEKRQRVELFNQATARKASETHEKALATLKSEYSTELAATRAAGGLRIPARRCPAIAGTAQGPSTSGPDEAGASTEKLPDRVEEHLFALAERADQLAEQLRALQGWVIDSGHYGTKPNQ